MGLKNAAEKINTIILGNLSSKVNRLTKKSKILPNLVGFGRILESLLGQPGGHREPLQRGPGGPAAAVIGRAGFIGGKLAAGGGLIAVDLPAAHAFAVFPLVGHKPGHIFRGISQEEADLMGKGSPSL